MTLPLLPSHLVTTMPVTERITYLGYLESRVIDCIYHGDLHKARHYLDLLIELEGDAG